MLGRCFDSSGALLALFGRAARGWAPICQAAQLGPETLAEQAAELLEENSYGQFDGLVPALKDALGDWGLKLLGSYIRQQGAADGNTYLLQIAVARGDVDGYLGQFSAEDLRWRETAASVASHLLASGRAEQALEILDGATEDTDGCPRSIGLTAALPCSIPSSAPARPSSCAGSGSAKAFPFPTCATT